MTRRPSENRRFDLELAEALERLAELSPQDPAEPFDPEYDPEQQPVLTIGIATFDDFDGAYFTVTSLLMHHAAAVQRCEILILDNHPEGREAGPLRDLAREYAHVPVRYLPFTQSRSTAVRDVIFALARTPWVMVLDSHVLLEPGAVDSLLGYIDDHPGSANLIQGPLVRADGTIAATHMQPRFNAGMFGTWAIDPRIELESGEPFDIPLHGLALFAMARDRWPGISPRFTGFGGEEGYVHEKVRRAGGATLCLPGLRWHHRFPRPRGVPYRLDYSDRINNYLVGWAEIERDPGEIHREFSGLLGDRPYLQIRRSVERRLSHPIAPFGVWVASDDDRVAPWRSILREAKTQSLSVTRIPLSRSALGADWWRSAVAEALRRAALRPTLPVCVLDERIGLPLRVFYLVHALSRRHPDAVILGRSAGRPAVIIIPASRVTDTRDAWHADDHPGAAPRPAPDIELDLGDASDTARLEAAAIPEGWSINSAKHLHRWDRLYPQWAANGMGLTMHRLPAVAALPAELQQAIGWVQALSRTANPGAVTLISSTEVFLSVDAAAVISEALRELPTDPEDPHTRPWELLSVSTPVAAPPRTPQMFAEPSPTPDAAVVLVSPAGRSRLLELLPRYVPEDDRDWLDDWRRWSDEHEDLGTWLERMVADGALSAWRSWPPAAVNRRFPAVDSLPFSGRFER